MITNGNESEERINRHKLAGALVLTSQEIPLHAGQDFLGRKAATVTVI